jgi:serpin B
MACSNGRPIAGLSPAQATESFGLSLMHRLPAGNLVFSPDSIAAALAMTGTGAACQTARQIAQSFAAVGGMQQAIAAEQSLAAGDSPEAPSLNIANGLFLQQGFALEAPFSAGLAQSFGASPQAVDFETPGAVEAINARAAQQTHGLIPHVLMELPAQTRLALANAIYLKAAWSDAFKTRDTAPAPFHGTRATTSADFMHETESLPYAEGKRFTAVSLPYRDSTLSLIIVLPQGESLRTLEHHLDARAMDQIVESLRHRTVSVSLPRFHLQNRMMLEAPLESLGMTDAFAAGKADFSRITKAERLSIGEAVHAADIKVDEQGTEAAAVTIVGAEVVSATVFRHVAQFNANHPFLFFLRDDKTGALLSPDGSSRRKTDVLQARIPAS